jgi:hypothetical protein
MSNPTEQAILEFLIETHKADKQLNAWIDNVAKNLHQKLRGPKGEFLPIEQIRREVITSAKLLQKQYEDQNKVARSASIARIKIAKQQAEELTKINEKQNAIDSVVANTQAAMAKKDRDTRRKEILQGFADRKAINEKQNAIDSVVANTQAAMAKKDRDTRRKEILQGFADRKAMNEKQLRIDAEFAKQTAIMNEKAAAKARANSYVGAGKAGRVGAGIATMTGNYQMAGGLYAAANILDSLDVKIPKTAALMAGLFAAPVIAGGGLLLYGRELNKELANMSTLLLDSSASSASLREEMDKAALSAGRLATTFNVDIVDVVKAYKVALSSGIESADLERFTYQAGVLSTALGEDLGSAVGILTTFKDTYGVTIGEIGKVNDVLFNIVDKGKVNTKEMISQLGRVLAPAAEAGLSIEQLAGAYATLTRGMKNTQAVTGIGRLITDVISPGKQAAKTFDELGLAFGRAAFESNGILGF